MHELSVSKFKFFSDLFVWITRCDMGPKLMDLPSASQMFGWPYRVDRL